MALKNKYKITCKENTVKEYSLIKNQIDRADNEGLELDKLYIYPILKAKPKDLDDDEDRIIYQSRIQDTINPEGVRAIMQALYDTAFPSLREIRIWKVDCRNEGARMVAKFLSKNKTVSLCDMMGNSITQLGCEFFGKMLAPSIKPIWDASKLQYKNNYLKTLKLDHNPIGAGGLAELARGLCSNGTLTVNYIL